VNGAFNIGRKTFPELFSQDTMISLIRSNIKLIEDKDPKNNNYLALMHILEKINPDFNIEGSQNFIFLRKVMMLNPHVIPTSSFVNENYNINKKILGDAFEIKKKKSKYDSVPLDNFKYGKMHTKV